MTGKHEKPHFSDRVLDLSERFQHRLGHTAIGERIVSKFTGSSSEAYMQLDWRSQKVNSVMTYDVEVPADPEAGYLAKDWGRAALVALNRERLQRLKDAHRAHIEAIAYVSDAKVHVGTMAVDGALFQEYNETEDAFAVRKGHSSVRYAGGIWIPSERTFVSSAGIYIANADVAVDAVAQEYPGIRLG